MILSSHALTKADLYSLMIHTIIPRPIAWILSDNGNGSVNLAPFSFFNGVTSEPPIISVSIGQKRDNSKKDTWRNIEERSWFVVHIPSVTDAKMVSQTSAPLPFGQSELTGTPLTLTQDEGMPLPRLSHVPVAFYCKRHAILEVGEGPQGLVLGEIMHTYLADHIANPDHPVTPDPKAIDPLARLGGISYAPLAAPFNIPRPQ